MYIYICYCEAYQKDVIFPPSSDQLGELQQPLALLPRLAPVPSFQSFFEINVKYSTTNIFAPIKCIQREVEEWWTFLLRKKFCSIFYKNTWPHVYAKKRKQMKGLFFDQAGPWKSNFVLNLSMLSFPKLRILSVCDHRMILTVILQRVLHWATRNEWNHIILHLH